VGGAHNSDLSSTRARLTRGATWKRQRVVVVLPAADTIASRVALSHWNLQFPPNNGVVRMLALGQEVGEAYTNAIEAILAHPELSTWEYLLCIEHDNMPPSDGLVRLLERMEASPQFSAIGGLYYTQGPGGVAQIWGDPSDPILNFRPMLPDPAGGLVECNGTGMGFTLYRLAMFKDAKLRRPWFKTSPGHTHDLYFSEDARKNGHRFAIDCGVRVGHYDLTGARGGIPDMVW
jgi:hypothetical protein